MLLYSFIVWISLIHLVHHSEASSMARHVPRRTRAVKSEDNNEISDELTFKPTVPKECEDIGICSYVPEYPHDYVAQMVEQLSKSNQTKFNMDIMEITGRFGPEEENMELCNSKEMLYAPQAARSSFGKWHYILNKKSEPVQMFRVEVCNKQNVQCNPMVIFPIGNEGYCKQKYILRSMVALDYRGNIFEDFFFIPSCCSCVYRLANIP